MIYVVAETRLKPGTTESIKEAGKKAVAETLKETGCISYDFYVSISDPTKLVAVERWETREQLSVHGQTPHIKAWREAVNPNVESRVIEIISPADVETKKG